MERRIQRLEENCRTCANPPSQFSPSIPDAQTSSPPVSESSKETSNPQSTTLYQRTENVGDVSLNLSCNLGSFPGSSIVSLAFSELGPQPLYKPDLISSGLISLEAAEDYFKTYHKYMDPCVNRVLLENDCLANIRARSSFLTAAILTVGSLAADLEGHQKCLDTFIKEVSSRLFSRNHSFDDVRALCIGAFWLNKVSSTLMGLGMLAIPYDIKS